MSRKQKIILAITLAIIVSIVGLSLFITARRSPTGQSKGEIEGPVSVVIDNTNSLEEILLARQFSIVRQELSIFIRTIIDKNIDYAIITEKPAIDNDGNVTFQVKTSRPDMTFSVKLVRQGFNSIDFIVASKNYQKTLQPYPGDTSTGD